MSKLIKITFKENGEGVIEFDGKKYDCLGQKGRIYPEDLTVYPKDKKLKHWSKEFKVWLHYAILIWGQKGIYIHQGPDNIADNGNLDSAGCIHVAEPQVIELYNWLDERTRVLISYPWGASV